MELYLVSKKLHLGTKGMVFSCECGFVGGGRGEEEEHVQLRIGFNRVLSKWKVCVFFPFSF
jgi:hypothetical protein